MTEPQDDKKSFLTNRKDKGEIPKVNTFGNDFKDKTAIGYCRVSLRKQKDDGMSLDTQKEVIEKFCSDNKIQLLATFSEAGHGHEDINKRQELGNAFEYLTNKKCNLFIVTKQDRLARDNGLFDKYIKQYFISKNPIHKFLCLDDLGNDVNMPEGMFTAGIKSNFSVLERIKIGARTKMSLDRMKRRGLKTGGFIPHGYKQEIKHENGKDVKYVVEDPEQMKVWNFMKDKHENNSWGWTKIAEELEKMKFKNKKGKVSWSASSVYRVFNPHKKK